MYIYVFFASAYYYAMGNAMFISQMFAYLVCMCVYIYNTYAFQPHPRDQTASLIINSIFQTVSKFLSQFFILCFQEILLYSISTVCSLVLGILGEKCTGATAILRCANHKIHLSCQWSCRMVMWSCRIQAVTSGLTRAAAGLHPFSLYLSLIHISEPTRRA